MNIKKRVKEGPRKDDEISVFILSFMIWWRIWGLSLLPICGLILITYGVSQTDINIVLASYFIGILLGGLLMKISPKYEVKKRF